MIALEALAQALGGTCFSGSSVQVQHVATLESATPKDLIFILEPQHLAKLDQLSFAAAVVGQAIPSDRPHIVVSNPRKALAQTLHILYPPIPTPPSRHPMALIDSTAELSDTVSVGAFSTIGARSHVGARTVLAERVSVGADCHVGNDCILYPGVTLYPGTQLGDRVIVRAGTVIGSDGFGYVSDSNGILKMPHIGRVVIESDVEIGANCTIDRGCLGDTHLGQGVKIDNLVHISHNTVIGSHSMIAAQCGFVGSATVGSQVQMGGQVGVSRVTIGDGCIVAAKSGVTKDIAAGTLVSGFPAWPHRDEIQKEAFIRRLYKEHRRKKNA